MDSLDECLVEKWLITAFGDESNEKVVYYKLHNNW